ncbi:UNVERIFIED_CONTAM: putative zinc ribbon protein [Acetivibrio alkalicellulosi]
MSDKTLTCKDCNVEFIFTEGEQNFYKEKGFLNEPQRCLSCRSAKKNQKRGFNNFPRAGSFGNRIELKYGGR